MPNVFVTDVKYEGRSTDRTHATHPLMKCAFLWRSRVLETRLTEFDGTAPVFGAWLDHSRSYEAAGLTRAEQAPGYDRDIQSLRNISPRQKGPKTYE